MEMRISSRRKGTSTSTADANANARSSRTTDSRSSTSVSTSAYKAAYNRHRRRPNEPNFIGDVVNNDGHGDGIDLSIYHIHMSTNSQSDSDRRKPDDRIIPLVNPNIHTSSFGERLDRNENGSK